MTFHFFGIWILFICLREWHLFPLVLHGSCIIKLKSVSMSFWYPQFQSNLLFCQWILFCWNISNSLDIHVSTVTIDTCLSCPTSTLKGAYCSIYMLFFTSMHWLMCSIYNPPIHVCFSWQIFIFYFWQLNSNYICIF